MVADFDLIINGKKIAMNEFVSDVIHDIMVALLSKLHNVELEKIRKIEVE